ncbi:MAG: hypothetical protein CMN78_06545 [Spirochaetales bacterium]|nr:hypothetical protein [Spirochaetales bacterium]
MLIEWEEIEIAAPWSREELHMDDKVEMLVQITKDEFDGNSFNGPPLIKTLQSLSFEQITSIETYEGYSVWAIVLHLIYWKHTLTAYLGGSPGVDPFPYEEKDWPGPPESPTPEAWEKTMEHLRGAHEHYLSALKKRSAESLNDEIADWKCNVAKAVSWMATHDLYHVAQIRNMGVI